MKLINKIFSFGLAALSTSPVMASLNTTNINNSVVLTKCANESEKDLRCTVAYVGKNLTSDGLSIIARTNDSSPRGAIAYLKKVEHNQLANTTLKNNRGFEYKLPNETYSYISAPDQEKTDEKGAPCLFENMGINEMGVGNTCTLTCYSNDTVLSYDPFVYSGLGEEMFNQLIACQADSAKKAMQIVADAVDKHGADDANLILVTDQNETWLMELYSGHQYCAVKLPDDKMLVAGNEFILDSLSDLGISEANKDDCIVSPNLLSLPLEKGFAKFKDGIQDVYHLDLFNTYAAEGTTAHSGSQLFSDSCHMRTWRGYSLFEPAGTIAKQYDIDKKYPAMFVPKDENNVKRTDITVYDIMQIYRDQFDELIGKEGFERFTEAKAKGTLRCIATETARSVQIMTANPNLPKEFAVNAWFCPNSVNYAPFVLLNNAINSFDGEYAYQPDRFTYDDKCSSVIFRKLNSLAWPEREKYGYPLQDFWRTYEYIYTTQMQQVIDDASKLSSTSDAKKIITNFNKHVRDVHIQAAKDITKDLTWHDMNQSHEKTKNEFVPLIDIQQYLTNLGWTDFKQEGNTITFKYNNESGRLEIPEGYAYEKGKLYINLKEFDIEVTYRDNKAFVALEDLNNAIEDRYSLIKININDYLDKNNDLYWIIPVSICVPIVVAAIIVVPIIVSRKKKKAKQPKKQK